MEATVVSKMSLSKLGCNAGAAKDSDKPVRLAVIFGQANGLKQGEDKQRGRIWTALKGQFEALNIQTGERFSSGLLFLPEGFQDSIESSLAAISQSGAEGLSVKFGLEFRSVKASNPIGYSFQAVAVVPVETSDELSGLRQAIADTMKTKGLSGGEKLMLEAPATAPAANVVEAKKEEAKTAKK